MKPVFSFSSGKCKIYSLKWTAMVESATGRRKKKWYIRFIKVCSLYSLSTVWAKLSVWSGLKWGKLLFHIMHWEDIISNDVPKCSTGLKTLFIPVVLIKKGEDCETHLYHCLPLVWVDWIGWHLAFFLLQFVWGHHGWVLPNISVKGHSLANLLHWTHHFLSPTHQKKKIKGEVMAWQIINEFHSSIFVSLQLLLLKRNMG